MINVIHSFEEFKKSFPLEASNLEDMDHLYRIFLVKSIQRLAHGLAGVLANRATFSKAITHSGMAEQEQPFSPIETAELYRWAVTILTLTDAAFNAPNRVDLSMPVSK